VQAATPDSHPLAHFEKRMERAGDSACEKQFQKFNLLLWHTHSLTMTADKADQAGGLQHPRSGVRLSVCAYKCVAGEQWQGNVFAAIAPAVDFFAQRQEGLYAFGTQLLGDFLFKPVPRLDSIPRERIMAGTRNTGS